MRWIPLLALALAPMAPQAALALAAGEVYWAQGACGGACGMFDISAGGDFSGVAPFAAVDRVPGQIAFRQAPLEAFVTEFDLDRVVRVDTAGTVTPYATGIDGPTGVLVDSGGRILVASFMDGAVYDVTGGGDFSSASPFAWGFIFPRNLLELPTGEILLAQQTPINRAVFDISSGGDFNGAARFAWGFGFDGPLDLALDGSGRIFASTDGAVYEITGGGNVSGATHATGRGFAGLAVDGSGRLLASELVSGSIYDVTASGSYASATPFAFNLPGAGDTALDTVPGTASPPIVPALGGPATGLLAALLGIWGARRLSRSGTRSPRRA